MTRTVELRAINNHSGTNAVRKTGTKDGYYNFEVSFGYYLLTISTKGYQMYRTKVYIPSSVGLVRATILEKICFPKTPTNPERLRFAFSQPVVLKILC